MSQHEELLSSNMPKWPQMLVTGKDVTVEQAKEIIFLTDDFLTDAYENAGGNATKFNKEYRRRAGLDRYACKDDEVNPNRWRQQMNLIRLVREQFGFIETEYVHNDWASCAFIFGPHGWCSPQGRIHFIDNVGKWPSVAEVFIDWQKIAQRFPFLSLTATLMSGEGGDEDKKPVVSIKVENGQATLGPGDLTPHLAAGIEERDFTSFGFGDSRKELGLPPLWYDEFAARVRAYVDTITDEQVEAEG